MLRKYIVDHNTDIGHHSCGCCSISIHVAAWSFYPKQCGSWNTHYRMEQQIPMLWQKVNCKASTVLFQSTLAISSPITEQYSQHWLATVLFGGIVVVVVFESQLRIFNTFTQYQLRFASLFYADTQRQGVVRTKVRCLVKEGKKAYHEYLPPVVNHPVSCRRRGVCQTFKNCMNGTRP